MSNKILIIGTGRSGTHWLGYILGRHPDIRSTIEVSPGFNWVTQMALDPSTRDQYYSKLVWYYRWQHLKSGTKHYLDKSHPNLWIADRLAETFDDALFLGIQRNPYATVASMLNHKGVKKWHKNWRSFPLPNKFLGISEDDISTYNEKSMVEKCAKRWKSHNKRMQKMDIKIGSRMIVINHEDLILNTESTLSRIENFIGLQDKLKVKKIDYTTINKWEDELTSGDIKEINRVTGKMPTR
jgi:hypothetical protein